MIRASLILRARASLSKKPMKAAKRNVIGKKGKSADQAAQFNQSSAAQIKDVVLPQFPEPSTTTSAATDAQQAEKHALIEKAAENWNRMRYEAKRTELDRMYAKMKEACLELEKTDPSLFKKAMIKEMGQYFPIERRIPVDTPPVIGWNHENRLSTAVKDLESNNKE